MNTSKKTYYKIVRKIDNELFSYLGRELNHNWKVTYKPHVWTKPLVEYSRLFVFDSIQDALDFLGWDKIQDSSYEIWECEVRGVGKSLLTRPYNICISEFWATKKKKKKWNEYTKTVKGASSAKEVRLVHRILELE